MNQNFLKKARQLQQEMMQTQKEIEETEFTTTAGGVVSVTLKGNKELKTVKITDFVPDGAEDLEMLGEMIVAACNHAYREIEHLTSEKMEKYQAFLGGMGSLF